MLNAVYTTICTLLKQISRMTADTAAATGHALRTDDGIAASQKEGSPPMKTKSSRFDSIARFSLRHDRIETISPRSLRAISLRLPARIFGRENEHFERISRLRKRFRRCGSSVMSRQ